MEPSEYTEAFAAYILECKKQYEDLCESLDNGEIPAGSGAAIVIDMDPATVDVIRFDRLAVAAGNGHG